VRLGAAGTVFWGAPKAGKDHLLCPAPGSPGIKARPIGLGELQTPPKALCTTQTQQLQARKTPWGTGATDPPKIEHL